jgi:xylulose-5-phosphate/fructose-6-phosphate phosphoketolase
MTVLNDMDRWHLVMDVLQRVPGLAAKTACLKQELLDKLIEHGHYIRQEGVDLPEVREWSWSAPEAGVLR